MASQTDDVGALFKSIGQDRNSYRELTRSADAAESEERWPLLKSIPPERREAPPALSNLHKNQIWNSQESTSPRERGAPRSFNGLGEKLAKSLLKITEGNLPFATSNGGATRASDGYRAAPAPQPQQTRAPEPRFEAAEPRDRRRNQAQFSAAPPPAESAPRQREAPMFQSRVEQRGPAYAPTQARARENDRSMFSGQAAPTRHAESGRGMFSNVVAPHQNTNGGRGLFSEPAPQPARQSVNSLFAREPEAPVRQQSATGRSGGSLQTIFKALEGEKDNGAPASGSRADILGRLNRR